MAMNSIGEFVLIIGDIHIPQRAASLPEQFRDLLMPGKMQHVICPGNVGSREVSFIIDCFVFNFLILPALCSLSNGLRIWLPQKVRRIS